MGCPRREYWSVLPFPPTGDLPDPGIEPTSLASPALAGGFFTAVLPVKPHIHISPLLGFPYHLCCHRAMSRVQCNTVQVFPVVQMVKSLPVMRETQVWLLGQEDSLETGITIQSSVLIWRIPWTEETGGLSSLGSQRVGHDWVTKLHTVGPR